MRIPPSSVRGSALASLLAAPSRGVSHGAMLAGVTMPDQSTQAGKSLRLNGLGLRTATIFNVEIYVMGLYVESPSADAEEIVASVGAKQIVLHFLHEVDADTLRDGWSEGFSSNFDDVASIQTQIDRFNASMRDVEVGDRIVLDFAGESVVVQINDATIDTVPGAAFQRATLSIWLGAKPPSAELKKGILGE